MSDVATSGRVSTLRGPPAGEIDGRRVRVVLTIACTGVLAALAASLFVAGARKNAQITALHRHGVPVVVTVTSCMGLLGGSGSNAAGYTCRGSFALHDHRYLDNIPGSRDRPPGTTLHAITLESDPGLLTTMSQLASDRASAGVFLLPAVLAVVLVVVVVLALGRSRRRSPPASRH